MIKKAMVMAAGVGSRLGVLTQNTPKPLVPVINKPVMDILLEKLKFYGIDSVIANTHYLGAKIQERYTINSPVDLDFHYIYEEDLSGTAGGVKKCEHFFKDCDDFLVVSADGLHDADLNRIIKSHEESGCIATMAVIPIEKKEVCNYGVVVSSPQHTVLEFQEKPPVEEAKSNCINTGIYVFNKRIFDFIPPDTKYDFAKNVFPALLNANEKINTYRIYSYWSDIGTIQQYIQSNFDALSKKVMISDVHIVRNIDSRYIMGENTFVDESVQLLDNCVIGSNCKIEKGAALRNVILWDNVTVKSGIKLEDCIVVSDNIVSESAKGQIIAGKIYENV